MQKKKLAEILNFNTRRQPLSQAEAAERSEALRLTPSFLNMVIENIPAMVAVKDARDLRFVLVNRHCEELTGVLRHDALGKNDFDLFPKEQAEFFVARDREVLASGKAQVIPEEQITTLHKGIRTLRTIKMPVLNEMGRTQYLRVMSQDITDQKRTEEALVQDERRWAFGLGRAGRGGGGEGVCGCTTRMGWRCWWSTVYGRCAARSSTNRRSRSTRSRRSSGPCSIEKGREERVHRTCLRVRRLDLEHREIGALCKIES